MYSYPVTESSSACFSNAIPKKFSNVSYFISYVVSLLHVSAELCSLTFEMAPIYNAIKPDGDAIKQITEIKQKIIIIIIKR